jgi:hypothetical protein
MAHHAILVTPTGINTLVNTRTVSGTDKAPTHSWMEINTSVSTGMANGPGKAPFSMLMDQSHPQAFGWMESS